ncbi:MAG: hypothetical protein LBT98_02570, partial [Puniceicoccales bacterium]|nr:hypothetical protein [Puniceicoccales bacterium]
ACLAAIGTVVFSIAHSAVQWKWGMSVEDYVTILSKMPKSTLLGDALKTIVKKSCVSLLFSDINEIHTCIQRIILQKTKLLMSNLKLEDLQNLKDTRKPSEVDYYNLDCKNLANSFPVLAAILLLITDSLFVCAKDDIGICVIHNYSTVENWELSYIDKNAYFIQNCSHPSPGEEQENILSAKNEFRRGSVYVGHYNSAGTLVIDS